MHSGHTYTSRNQSISEDYSPRLIKNGMHSVHNLFSIGYDIPTLAVIKVQSYRKHS